MMTKKVYVASVEVFEGDSWNLIVTEDKAIAEKAAREDRKYTDKRDRANRRWWVMAWNIPCEEGQTIEQAYDAWNAEQCWQPDPVESEVIETSSETKVTDRAKLFDNIKKAVLECLQDRKSVWYAIDEDMSLTEDTDEGILNIDCRSFECDSLSDYLTDFESDDPNEIRAEVIRRFYDLDEDGFTADEINEAIDKLENLEAGDFVHITF